MAAGRRLKKSLLLICFFWNAMTIRLFTDTPSSEAHALYYQALKCYQKCLEEGVAEQIDRGVDSGFCDFFLLMQRAALQGHIEAMLFTGYFYQTGKGALTDPKMATYWYRQASQAGSPEASVFIAKQMEQRNSDPELILASMKEAARLNYNSRADMESYFPAEQLTGFNYRQFQVFWQAAQAGDADAACWVGICYEKGFAVAIDLAQAFYWYQRAIDLGSAEANFYIGLFYETARTPVLQSDFPLAMRYYQKAVDMGSHQASLHLGLLARKQGNLPLAMQYLSGQYLVMPEQILVVEDLVRLKEKEALKVELAGLAGDMQAQLFSGIIYEKGYGLPVSASKAEWWYEQSFLSGNDLAGCYLAQLYLSTKQEKKYSLAKGLLQNGYAAGQFLFCQQVWEQLQ